MEKELVQRTREEMKDMIEKDSSGEMWELGREREREVCMEQK